MTLQDQIENLLRQTGPMTMRSIRAHFPSPWRDGGVRNRKRIGDALASLALRGKVTVTRDDDNDENSPWVYAWDSQSSSALRSSPQ